MQTDGEHYIHFTLLSMLALTESGALRTCS